MSKDAEGERGLALRSDAVRTRILSGVRLGAGERPGSSGSCSTRRSTWTHARVMIGIDHHSDLADKVDELIAAAQQAEQRRAGS